MSVILGIIAFIPASILALYIPGRVALGNKHRHSGFVSACISLLVGIVLFAWQGFVFGFFHMRWATYIYLAIFFIVFVFKKYYPTRFSVLYKNIDWFSVCLIVVGVFAQTISYIRMGWITSAGMIISTHNTVDHIWHAALTNELVKRYPPNEPGLSGVALKDYHYWFNLVTAEMIRVFHLPLFPTQFIGMYFLGSILLGGIVYIVAKSIYPSKLFIRLSLFFVYFIGNAAGWYMLFVSRVFDWNVSSLIVDGTKFMDSPAYAYAILAGLTGIFFLLQKKLSLRYAFLAALCFGSLIEFKVYVGIAFFAGLGCFALYSLFGKNIKVVGTFVLSVILGLIIFLPAITPGGGLAYIPFDIPRDFINQVKLGHIDWQLSWVIFQQHHNIPRIIQYGLMMSGVYFLIQYGLLLLGFIPFQLMRKKFGGILFFLYPAIITSIVMGLLFYQKVGGANIWEFFLAGVPFLCLLLAINITNLLENKRSLVQISLLTLITVLIIPQWVISLKQDISTEFFQPFHGISHAELASYTFLENNTPTSSVVLILGQQKYVAYASLSSILSHRDLYLSGEGVRQVKTPVIVHREDVVKKVASTNDTAQIADTLSREHVNYLYVFNRLYPDISADGIHLRQIFTNQIATIYQVTP